MHFNNTLSWKLVTQQEYVNSVSDDEKLYYIRIVNGVPYLLADIEHGGDEKVQLRVELYTDIYPLGFCLIPNGRETIYDNISDLVSECRGYYTGGITFIEYTSRVEAEGNVLNDFLNTYHKLGITREGISSICPIYVKCIESSLHKLVQVFPNADLFIQIIDKIKE